MLFSVNRPEERKRNSGKWCAGRCWEPAFHTSLLKQLFAKVWFE